MPTSKQREGSDAVLPPLYAGWMQALLRGPIPAEERATCSHCAMLPPSGAEPAARPATAAGEFFFSPTTKCCTYVPELANFLVGRVLLDRDPAAAAGRATVEARIDKGLGVTPVGLQRTSLYTFLYRHSPAAFGQASSMRCPHFLADQGGLCGVWRHRESTCATWFCKYNRGETGRIFWQRLYDLLRAVESALSLHCLTELGFASDPLGVLFFPHSRGRRQQGADGFTASEIDAKVDPGRYRALWGDWLGRERELYMRCAEIAGSLSWSDVVSLGGVSVALMSRLLSEAYAALLSEELPPRLGRRQLRVVYESAETAQIVGYSNLDPLRVPKKLIDALHGFDGRPTEEALNAIAAQHGIRLTPGTVRKLADFGALATLDAPATAAPTPRGGRD